MAKPTGQQLLAMQAIRARSKGWPVGIPQAKRMAAALVDKGLAEWAPPVWMGQATLHCVRLTTLGMLYAGGRM